MTNIDANWMLKYNLAKKYFEYYGDLLIPNRFSTKDGINYDENGVKLGRWILRQRQAYKGFEKVMNTIYAINQSKVDLLNEIGMVWQVAEWRKNTSKWMEYYEMLKKFYNKHNHTSLPTNFLTKDGINYDPEGVNLYSWLQDQRSTQKKNPKGCCYLTKNQMQMLEELKVDFTESSHSKDYAQREWERRYNLCKNYFEHFNNLEVPEDFKTKNGYEYDEKGDNISTWLDRQRKRLRVLTGFASLSEKEIEKLNSIGMIWEIKKEKKVSSVSDKLWEAGYSHLKAYKDEHNSTFVKYDYICKDNYHLGNWVSNQRVKYRKGTLPLDKIERLNALGMIWDASKNYDKNKIKWVDYYNLAAKFKEEHNHLNVPSDYITSDGITEDQSGLELGRWINKQRTKYSYDELTKEKTKMLRELGMIWDLDKNNVNMEKLCFNYNIDENYLQTLRRLPVREVKSKIKFLKDNNLPLIENNNLHPIFFMSNKNLEVKYGITLENMIEKYRVKKV